MYPSIGKSDVIGDCLILSCFPGTSGFTHPGLLLLDPLGNEKYLKLLEELEDEQTPKPEEALLCVNCQHKITTPQEKTVINSSHSHLLTNPYGMKFNVGCFNNADGCMVFGELTSAYSWFPEYYWQYAHCRNCHIHLGWLFSSPSQQRFFGLILDKLSSP